MTGTDTRDDPSDGLDPRIWRVAAVALVGPFMTQLDSTVVNLALPTIRQALHSPIATAQWIITGYLLALALMLPLSGWLVDRVERSGCTWGASRRSRWLRVSAVPRGRWIH